jgi:hypothetical protein
MNVGPNNKKPKQYRLSLTRIKHALYETNMTNKRNYLCGKMIAFSELKPKTFNLALSGNIGFYMSRTSP